MKLCVSNFAKMSASGMPARRYCARVANGEEMGNSRFVRVAAHAPNGNTIEPM